MSEEIRNSSNYSDSESIVRDWMTRDPFTVKPESTVEEAINILDVHDIFSVPVVDGDGMYLGLVTKTVLMQLFLKDKSLDTRVDAVMTRDATVIGPDDPVSKAMGMKDGALPVVDGLGRLQGIITRTDILSANSGYIRKVKDKLDSSETLKHVLNSAYEGVVVVDKNCTILEFNEAYGRFIGKRPEDVIGKNVEDIIENTRLPVVVRTGIEERGHIQRIRGQDMVVHRIPIKKNGEVTGAIGMLIFADVNELYNIIGRVHKKRDLDKKGKNEPTRKEKFLLGKIIGSSGPMQKAKDLARRAARTPSTVLITGASGTGKELFAQAIHDMSLFSEGPLVSVNCSAIPESLLESELFGYEEGAFTDARKGGRKGKFELAHNGTIFLDEIGDMPLFMQAKILRVLQDRIVEPVGGTQKRKINVRIIAATNKNLEEMIMNGTFREDLYYRINIIRLELPELKERKEDIEELLSGFIRRFCSEFGFHEKVLTPEAMEMLVSYGWPGNVRELENAAEMLVSLTEGDVIGVGDLPKKISDAGIRQNHDTSSALKDRAMEGERQAIREMLEECSGNKAEAARRLGIQRSTLYEKMKKLGMN